LGFADFEDAVIAAIARREKADYIITRNIKDYSKSPIPAITPEEFLAL
jgi:predicted nucleic acid-binding protein